MGYDWDKISADLSQFADVEREKPLAEMTSFGIGGPARIVVQPMDRDEVLTEKRGNSTPVRRPLEEKQTQRLSNEDASGHTPYS